MTHSNTVDCAVALGSNLGNSQQNVESAIAALGHHSHITIKATSSWYETVPVGPAQPNYVNGCTILTTCLSPLDLLDTLLDIENQFGRVRQERWGARTLDLDLLLYNHQILDHPRLKLPHPSMRERAFVLIPLVEIAPNWIDPITETTITQLKNTVDCSGILQKLS